MTETATALPPIELASAGPGERTLIPFNVAMHGGRKSRGGPGLDRVFKKLDGTDDARQTPADPYADEYGIDPLQPLQPDRDLEYLGRLSEHSNILSPVISAMADNVAGHGIQLELRDEVTVEDRDANTEAIEAERLRLIELLGHIHYRDSLTKIRGTIRRRMEKMGFGGYEVIPDGTGAPAILEPLWTQYLRRCPEDPEMVHWTQPTYDPKTLQWGERKVWRRFRRYVYVRNRTYSSRLYLREWGDPRVLDAKSGKFYPPGHPVDPKTNRIIDSDGKLAGPAAHEVIVMGLDDDAGPYPVPRYVGCLAEITMSWYGSQTNLARFENPVPPMLILVSGGTVTEPSIKRLKEHFEASQDLNAVGAPLLLSAEPMETTAAISGIGGTATVKIEVIMLDRVMQTDGLFQELDENNRRKIRACWKLSPMATGESSDFSRAAAQAGRDHDETEVYEPARTDEDLALFDLALLPRWGIRFWRVVSNPSPSLGDEDLPELLAEGRESRALSSDDTRRIIGRRLRVNLPPRDAAWSDLPASFIPEGFLDPEELDDLAAMDVADRTAANDAGGNDDDAGGGAEGEATGLDDEGEDVEQTKRVRRVLKAAATALGVRPSDLVRAAKLSQGAPTAADVLRQARDLGAGLTAATDALVERHDK